MLQALRRAAGGMPVDGRRVFSLGDNLSCLLAYERGRAWCYRLRMLCAQAAAYQVGAELIWSVRCMESERNAADYSSRAGNRGELRSGEFRNLEGLELSALFTLHHERPPGEPPPELAPASPPLHAKRWSRGPAGGA